MIMLKEGLKKEWVNFLAIACLIIVPLTGSDYNVSLISKIMAYSVVAMSFDIMWGYTGMLSFGHSAFFALGAYAVGLTLKMTGSASYTYLAYFMGILVPMLVAMALGYFIFYGRVSGVYFGIITMAFTTILQQMFITFSKVTGGSNGLYKFPKPEFVLPGGISINITNSNVMYYFCLVVMVLCYVLCKKVLNRPFGRIVTGIRNNEGRMDFLGYSTAFLKMMVFAISAGIAGFGGALFASVGFISPTLFGLALSTSIIVWVAVGGRGTLIGAVVGTFLICYLEDTLSSSFQTIWQLFEGLFMILIIILLPQGVMGYIKKKFERTYIG